MIRILPWLCAALVAAASALAASSSPAPSQPLPSLTINDGGELVFDSDDIAYRPWRSDQLPGKVHVLQYFPGTHGDSKIFEPFTDRLLAEIEPGDFHFTTIINLDAAMWGTSDFVVSEMKKNKRQHPELSLVLDAQGIGAQHWQLGKKGAGLMIIDPQGVVQFFSTGPLNEAQIQSQLALVRSFRAD